jgi:hypothetical protein
VGLLIYYHLLGFYGIFFLFSRNTEVGKTSVVWGMEPVEGGRRLYSVKYYALLCDLLKLFQEVGARRIKDNDEGDEFNCDIL